MAIHRSVPAWAGIPDQLRARGLRWTPQRRQIIEVLEATDGHITGSDVVERCRQLDPLTTPSTVYRTLRVLEELGIVQHAHGADGHEEFHVRPASEHGHLYCEVCGSSWEIDEADAEPTISSFDERHGFAVDLTHMTIVGRCQTCRDPGKNTRGYGVSRSSGISDAMA